MTEDFSCSVFSSDVNKLIASRACHVSQYNGRNGVLGDPRYSIDSYITYIVANLHLMLALFPCSQSRADIRTSNVNIRTCKAYVTEPHSKIDTLHI